MTVNLELWARDVKTLGLKLCRLPFPWTLRVVLPGCFPTTPMETSESSSSNAPLESIRSSEPSSTRLYGGLWCIKTRTSVQGFYAFHKVWLQFDVCSQRVHGKKVSIRDILAHVRPTKTSDTLFESSWYTALTGVKNIWGVRILWPNRHDPVSTWKVSFQT